MTQTTVLTARVGSQAGLQAIGSGLAHAAGCHVRDEVVRKELAHKGGYYMINLFERQQGCFSTRPDWVK